MHLHRRLAWLAALAVVLPVFAAAPKANKGPALAIAPEPIPTSAWKEAPKKAVTSAEIDAMIEAGLKKAGLKPGPVVSDERFLRRVYLDLWGRPPSLDEVNDFLADKSPSKRSRVIDKLLDGDAYSRHWAGYWNDVIGMRLVGNFQGRILARSFQMWLGQQLKKNRPWNEITSDLLTASGEARFDDREGKSGPAFFLASHMGQDAVAEQAAETARVFMGIQINCAQCHDHPFDSWKREQFHELAAYFARVRTTFIIDRESERIRFLGVQLVSMDRGFGGFGMRRPGMMRPGMGRFGGGVEYRMPPKEGGNRFSGKVVHPRSLDGKAPKQGLSDKDRRKALVEAVTSKDNHWFAAAYANRIWGVLLGQPFYSQVDDLGPQREAVHGTVLARLASHFAATDYDMKQLFRVIMNTQAYQRESKVGLSRGEHNLFAYSYPTRLRPGQLYESVVNTVGPLGGGFGGGRGRGMMMGFGGGGRRFGFGGFGIEGMIRSEFNFDPSLKNDDVEGSIPQALILMNSAQLNQRIKATRGTFLGRLLDKEKKDGPAIEAVYRQALGRKPATREVEKCLAYIAKVGDRAEAFEDILWAVMNSAEFQTRR